jgi:hypothetical protein
MYSMGAVAAAAQPRPCCLHSSTAKAQQLSCSPNLMQAMQDYHMAQQRQHWQHPQWALQSLQLQ